MAHHPRAREILERAEKLLEKESETAKIYRDPEFSLEKWKATVEGYKTV